MEKSDGNSSEIEIVLDIVTAANKNSNKIDRDPNCDFKTIEPKVEPKPIIISEHIGPPDFINVDDDSDEEITFLGTFTSSTELPENTQPSNVKEERTTSKPEQNINHCMLGSDVKETSKSQHIIPDVEESQDSVNRILTTKLNINSTLPVIEGKSSSKSQCNIHTSSSVILSGINRANQTSHANLSSATSEKSLKNDCLNFGSANKTLLCGQEKQTNASHADPVICSATETGLKSNVISKNLQSNICSPKERSTNFNQIGSSVVCSPEEANSSRSNEVKNRSVLLQKNTSSSGVTVSSPTSSNGSGMLNDHHKDNDSTTTVQNLRLNPGSQQTFGSKIKQQVRYVTLPAKFLAGKVTKQITSSISTGSNVFKVVQAGVNKTPVNMHALKGELPFKVGDKTQRSVGPKVQVSDVSGLSKAAKVQGAPVAKNPAVTSKKIVFIQNNPSVTTKSNDVKNNINTGPQTPPTMLMLNNQVFKLKGIKQQDPLSRDTSVHSTDSPRKNEPPVSIKSAKCGVDQCCQTDNSTKSVVDQSCQTHIYSWIYKNSKLYTFIDDGGKQVEIVPVETVQVAKPPIETDVESPVSSLDNESDMCLEDEISVTDEPTVSSNIELHHSSDYVSLQTGHAESCAHNNEIEPNTPKNIPCNYQPQNTFQEVLYTDLGLYNSASQSKDTIRNNSFGNQNNDFQSNAYQQENINANTVYNHELQMYMPSSQTPVPVPVFEQPAVVNPDIRYSTPNTNSIVDTFNKLIADIRTCLSIDSLGNIPLHQATIDNDLVKLKSQCIVLKSIGSHLNHLNLAHETALILAVKVAVDMSDYEAVSILVSEGADQRIADMEGNTPLHYAVRHGCDQLVRVLLTADDADKVTEKYNHDGLTPLHIAALEGHDDIIKLLVGTTIDINVKDRKNGRTPYFLAVKEKKWTSAKLLKMFGADVNEPNFADQMPLVFASPEKSLPQPQGNEENVDDSGNVLPQLNGTREQKKDIWESRFNHVGQKKTGLNPPPQVLGTKELQNSKEKVEKASEAFDAKELYDKYVKIAAKRKSDSQLEEPVAKPKTVNVKKSKPSGQSKTIDINFQSKNAAVSSGIEKSQSCESDRCINNCQSQSHCHPEEEAPLREYQHTINCKAIRSDIKCHKVHKISINNDSVLYNKAVLTSSNVIVQEHYLNSNVVRQNYGNETKPDEPKVASKVNKFAELTCEAGQDERPRGMQLNAIENSEIVQDFALEKNDQVHDITLNYTKQGSNFKNLSECPTLEHSVLKNSPSEDKGKCQSPSEVSTDKNLMSCLELYTDNPIKENESIMEQKQPVNPIGNFSKAHLSKNDQNISLNPASEITLGDKSNKLLSTPHLSVESQEMSQSSFKVINPNSENKNSIKSNPSVNPIAVSSLDYIHKPTSTVPKKTLGDSFNELIHLPKENHEKCQSSGIRHICNSEKKNSVESKHPMNFICNSSSDHLTKNSTNSPTQSPEITSRKRSYKMLKEKQPNSLSYTEHIIPNGGNKTSVGVKQIISNCSTSGLNEEHKNCPSIPLHTVTSNERSSEMLRKYHCKKAIEEHCDSNTKLNKELLPTQDFNSENQFVEKVPDNKIPENKTSCDSGDENICLADTSLNIDLGNVKDVIIENDSSKSNSDNTNINTCNLLSKAETEHVQLSFGALLDDVVNNKKKESISYKKPNPKKSRCRKRKLDESDVLMMNSQKAEFKKVMQKADLTDVATTATDRDNSLISYPQKVVSDSNQINNVSSSKMFLHSNTESKGLNVDNLQNTKLTKNVSGSEDIQNLNPEARGELRKSLLDDFESSKKPVLNSSTELVTNMRNKLVSLVSCKAMLPNKVSNNAALRESTTLSTSIQNLSEKILEKTGRRSSKSLSTDSESHSTEQINRSITPTASKFSRESTLSTSIQNLSEKILEKTGRRSSKSLSTDSESHSTEQINRSITPTASKFSNALTQENRTTSRKRSLGSVEQKSQEDEKKRIGNNNSEIITREEKDIQLVVSNTHSRRSTRISKKKVEFDL